MKVIMPVAGIGTRLRPHTLTRPKPLLDIAGRTIIDYVLKPLESIEVDELVVIVGFMGEQIKKYIDNNYDYKTTYITQDKLLGLGYAINLALLEIEDSEILIILGDTIVECDLNNLTKAGDYVLALKQVDDPHRFGIAEISEGRIIKLEEKPADPKTNLALIGLYYFKESRQLHKLLEAHVQSGKLTSGEIQFTDALQDMIKDGINFSAFEVNNWYDCGTKETLLSANRHFLKSIKQPAKFDGSTLHEPVFISEDACIVNSEIGPDVSVGLGVHIENSIVKNSIISSGAVIQNSKLESSLLGRNTKIKESVGKLNLGDNEEAVRYDGSKE